MDILKKCLIKQLIMRIDYQGLIDLDLDNVVNVLRKSLIPRGFSLREGQINHVNYTIPVQDPQTLINDDAASFQKSLVSSKVFTFKKDNVAININKNWSDINVRVVSNYKGSSVYLDIMTQIYNALKQNNEEMIIFTRLGIRKINTVILRDLSKINIYFNKDLFNQYVCSQLYNNSDKIDMAKTVLTLPIDNYKANIITNIQIGEMIDDSKNKISCYQILLDIDAYKDNISKEDDLSKDMPSLNTNIYNIYCKSLTDEFKKLLNNPLFEKDDNILEGVNNCE